MVNLGVFLPPEKAGKIGIPKRIESRCEQEGVTITNIACVEQLTDRNIDVLLHKVLDFHNEEECSNEFAKSVINKVKNFSEQNPSTVLLDDVDSCMRMSDRKICHDIMNACSMSACDINVFVPRSVEISGEMSTENVRKHVQDSNIRFPVLIKPLDTNDKVLTLVFNADGLDEIRTPSLVQEFFCHSGVMYKVFVIGDRYNIVQRPSIKDYQASESCKSISLDSKNVSKMGRGFHPEIHDSDPGARTWLSDIDHPDLLNRTVLDALCKKLADVGNVYMFGFDILVVKETGDYALVDLNQFPGYKGIPDDVFADNIVHMVKHCQRKKLLNSN